MKAARSQRRFEAAVLANEFIATILERMRSSDLPQWYVSGGCLFQTVWNLEHGFDAAAGILDYDLFYFDGADLSAQSERRIDGDFAKRFADLPIRLEARNQARVHLWYEEDFGAPCQAFRRCEDGIDGFLALCCCYGIRKTRSDELVVYAPHGFDDLFDLIVRPNPLRALDSSALASVYKSKVARWCRVWPRLKAQPWRSASSGPGASAHSSSQQIAALAGGVNRMSLRGAARRKRSGR